MLLLPPFLIILFDNICDAPKPEGSVDNPSTRGIPVDFG